MKYPVELSTHHTHLLLKPLKKSTNSHGISHALYLGLHLDNCLKLLNSFLSICFYTCPSPLPSMKILDSQFLFFYVLLRLRQQSGGHDWLSCSVHLDDTQTICVVFLQQGSTQRVQTEMELWSRLFPPPPAAEISLSHFILALIQLQTLNLSLQK